MRKLMMAGALAVVLVPLFATAALAAGQLIQCTTAPCYGGKGDDHLLTADTQDTRLLYILRWALLRKEY
jgi:hypothetical protein